MTNTIDSIDAYISAAPEEHRHILEEIRKIIKAAAPPETTEMITYQMPTFRYHGNLIHFALHKAHIGIYPGAETIVHFEQKLTAYKTTKGAIQIPLSENLPKALITELVVYNAERLKDKQGPNWHNNRDQWSEANEFMNELITRLPLVKTFKWGSDVYTFDNKNVIAWGGFKNFFSLWFYNGVFLQDPKKVLISASEGKTKSLRQWRFTDIAQLKSEEKAILSYIKESIQTVKDGKEILPEKNTPIVIEGFLKAALDADEALKASFEKLTPGKQKDYIEHIEEAKQEKTKISRLEKIRPLIMDGKGLHDKYKK